MAGGMMAWTPTRAELLAIARDIERLARCRSSWAGAAPGTGQELEGLLRAAVTANEMRGRR